MAHSVLNFLKRNFGKALLASSLFMSASTQAQTGNPIGGYNYLGSCTVEGQTHYYYVSIAEATWPVANAAATALGGGTGYLATLTSDPENLCVYQKYVNYLVNGADLVAGGVAGIGQPTIANSYADGRNPWIGLTDFAAENTFTWANGENCNDFRKWDVGEPNNVFKPGESNGEDYVQLLAFSDGPDASTGGNKKPMFWNDWFNGESQLYIVEFGPNTCIGDEGCSLGYWKNHEEDWQGFLTTQTLEAVFNIPDGLNLDNTTLLDALSFHGGPGVQGASQNLLRQAVAALLNAASSGVDYPLSVFQVVTQVNNALASDNRNTILALAGTLDQYNNYHGATLCPGERTSSSRQPVNSLSLAGDKKFAISGYPNPSRTGFSIQIDGAASEKATVTVTDISGRLVEQRTNVAANQVLKIGDNYQAGMYYVEVKQGLNKQQLKIVKQ